MAATTDAASAPAVSDDATPAPRPLNRIRPIEMGLVALLVLALYLPRLGSYNLWDPWETHYGEVARRMLEDHDWVRMRWQNEAFRSKPVLTFWLMAAGMKTFGVGNDGGYSGEFAVGNPHVEWAIRLPFALFGCAGIFILWFALARLYSKRAAWLAAIVLATCPYYFFISRQAITDMPSCSMYLASMALFALAYFDDRPIEKIGKWFDWRIGFLAIFSLLVVGQLTYFWFHLGETRWMLSPTQWIPGPYVMLPFAAVFAVTAYWCWRATKMRQLYMFGFALLNGVALLAKGPVSPVLSALTILFFLFLCWDPKKLVELELVWIQPAWLTIAISVVAFIGCFAIPIPLWARGLLALIIPTYHANLGFWAHRRGGKRYDFMPHWRWVLIFLAVSMPWHFAIYLKDGNGWLNEYLGQHILGRAFEGVFGDRGTFDYFLGQLGVGMWPWICFVPVALAGAAMRGMPKTREEKVRFLFLTWAVVGFTFFAAVQTKFHHYILPAVPGLAVVAAMWLDDLWEGKVEFPTVSLLVAGLLFAITTIDLVAKQLRLVNLFIFRYDRPWPDAAPWNIDYTTEIAVFRALMGLAILVMFANRLRKYAVAAAAVIGLVFAVFCVDVLLPAASPHWGQKNLHATYYKNRNIYGADLIYYGTKELADDLGGGKLVVKSVIPNTMHTGDAMKVTYELRNANDGVQEKGELHGTVSSFDIGDHEFTIQLDPDSVAKVQPLVDQGKKSSVEHRRFLAVNADRMIAWQLNWRGENFYSGGEIWNQRIEDMHTVYMDTDNREFLKYLADPARAGKGRKFWVVTEIGRLPSLKTTLPNKFAQSSFDDDLDHSSNKFGLARFQLDQGPAPATDVAPTP